MVNNHCLVLDAGVIKSIKEIIDMDPIIVGDWVKILCETKCIMNDIECNRIKRFEHDREKPIFSKRCYRNNSEMFAKHHNEWVDSADELHREYKNQQMFLDRIDPDQKIRNMKQWFECTHGQKLKQYDYACEYFKIEKFIPFICINVSPNWKKIGHTGRPSEKKKQIFHDAIRKFGECSKRFTEIHYVLECGGEGDHLHAHLVAKINPDLEKTIITQLRKGNLSRSFRKFFKQACKEHEFDAPPEYHETKWYQKEGMGGLVEGKFAIQFSLMRKKEFWQDKLDYLVEDRKPADHKNAYVLEEKRVIYF